MEQLQQFYDELLKNSQSVTCSGHTPFELNDPTKIAWVKAGIVNVFGIKVDSLQTTHRRVPILQAQTNALLFGIETNASRLNLIAAGNPDTELRVLTLANFKQLLAKPAYQGLLAKWMEKWLAGLFSRLAKQNAINATLTISQPAEVTLTELQTISSDACYWFKLQEGAVTYTEQSQILKPDDTFYPLIKPVWLTAQSAEAKLELIDHHTYLSQADFFASLAHFHQFILTEITQQLDEQQNQESRRFAIKKKGDTASVRNAFKKMLSILQTQNNELIADKAVYSALLTACQLVGKAQGIKIATPHPLPDSISLKDIIQHAGIQARQVQLAPNWWREDGGPLLVLRASDGAPCAAISDRHGRYYLLDPASGTKTLLDNKLAQEIAPDAFTFYRPFPQRKITGKDLLKSVIRDNIPDIMRVLLVGILGGLIGLIIPIFSGTLFNNVIPNAERGHLLQIVMAMTTAGITLGLFQLVRVYSVIRISGKANLRLESALWDRLIRLPMPFFKQFNTGDLTMRALAISNIRQILTGITVSAVLSVIFSIFSFILLFYYSWQLAFLATGLIIIIAAVTLGLSLWQIRYQRILQNLSGKVTGLLLQLINGIGKLQSAGRENKAFSLWAEQFSEQRLNGYKAGLIGNSLLTFNAVFMPITTLAIYALISSKLRHLPIGDFIAFNAAFGQFLGSIMGMTSSLIQSLTVIPLFERAKPILDEIPETSTAKIDPGVLRGDVELNHVSFRYAPDEPLVLKDISLKIKPGQFAAFVGKSGAGKSTVLRLLLGFEQPVTGSIFFDDKDISQLNMQRLRRQLGVVLQNSALVSESIFRNIVGSAPLTMDDAWEAARLAGFAEDIESMPMGMHTVLSEGARTISGGQRQRLMIARALAQKPSVLIFDEATSALDNRTQAIVSQSLEKLNITRMVIAHRLSTIANADIIFVMDNGEIVQQGTYQELAAQEGIFADLIKRQTV